MDSNGASASHVSLLAVAILFAGPTIAAAQVSHPSLTGSFVMFDRNLGTVEMWQHELATQAALGHKILILPGDGTLMPSPGDTTGFTVNPQTLIYPSRLFPATPPQPDNLGMLLAAADQFGMQVYIGSLQTHGVWSDGDEFNALHKYDPVIAQEILAQYGSHPSLNAGAGNWYFSHELWLNWVQFYGPDYYGISQLGTYVAQMKAISPRARIMEAPVFKKAGSGAMPGLSAPEAGTYLAMLAAGSGVDILAPQDGAGAVAGAPPVSELGDYYSEMRAALEHPVQLWTTLETFEVAAAGTESANGWQPAPFSRIRQQIAAEAPYVSQMIQFMYGWDMSPEATYTPVEADALRAQYTGEDADAQSLAGAVSYSSSPAGSYLDTVPSKLTNGTGGGFGQALADDWVGFEARSSGTLTINVDLGGPTPLTGVRILFAGMTASGIYFPQSVLTEYSGDNGASWFSLGGPDGEKPARDTPLSFTRAWVTATTARPVMVSQLRVTISFQEWLFIGEIRLAGPKSNSRLRTGSGRRFAGSEVM